MKKVIVILLICLAAVAIVVSGFFIILSIYTNRLTEIDRSYSPSGEYCAVLLEKGEAMIFAGSDIVLRLEKNGEIVSEYKGIIRNDGKTLDGSNWSTEWKTDSVSVTLKGEEQEDSTVMFSLD